MFVGVRFWCSFLAEPGVCFSVWGDTLLVAWFLAFFIRWYSDMVFCPCTARSLFFLWGATLVWGFWLGDSCQTYFLTVGVWVSSVGGNSAFRNLFPYREFSEWWLTILGSCPPWFTSILGVLIWRCPVVLDVSVDLIVTEFGTYPWLTSLVSWEIGGVFSFPKKWAIKVLL